MNVHAPSANFTVASDDNLSDTEYKQRLAADPAASAWVSANAGSGKTFVLALRVVRLLLDGVPPARILCLTYTKAGAAQMTARVHGRLAAWARMSEADLATELLEVTGPRPTRERLERARRLFAQAIETPGGLKIQTIHAFCESVLHRFPLEANVSGRFRKVDDAERAHLLRGLHARIVADDNGDEDAGAAVESVLRLGHEYALDTLFGAIDRTRFSVVDLLKNRGGAKGVAQALRERLGLTPHDTRDTILAECWPLEPLGPDVLRELVDCARRHGGVTNGKCADLIDTLWNATPDLRLKGLGTLLLTGEGKLRIKPDGDGLKLSHSFTKKVQDDLPWLLEVMRDAALALLDVRDRLSAVDLCAASAHAMTLAERLYEEWRALKHRRGLLDFDDMIARTAELLDRDGGGGWVHYKLDRGIDHILVDEAQDTSPLQWRVIERLAGEFFHGESASERSRTVFAVGDFKQSIYSFQGAEPRGFADQKQHFASLAGAARNAFHDVQLHLSFRSVPDVLSAVDAVFGDELRASGLTLDGTPVVHEARRMREAGHVDLWPLEIPDEAADPDDNWTRALDALAPNDPLARTASRVADTISAWIENGETLEATGRPIRPGDVMILVRKRDGFPAAITRALKDRHVPVEGADRLRLTAHVAIEDLMAVGRVVLDPHDDLALAAALKSPLLGLNETDLFALAHDRPEDQSLYRTLRRRADENGRWKVASERIAAWRQRVDTEPPFEFFARILGPDGGRAAFLARLGPETADVLDEFLAHALSDRNGALPGLEAFLADLATEAPEIKREMETGGGKGPGAVRVMTVHGAKGLEAPIVFLVDCGSKPVSSSHIPVLVPVPEPGALPRTGPRADTDAPSDPLVWTAPGLPKEPLVSGAIKALEERAEQEYRRLLYVGMTRAEDRLIVCGYRGKTDQPGIWHELVSKALLSHEACRELREPAGRPDDGHSANPAERVTHRFRVSPPSETVVAEIQDEVLGEREASPSWLYHPAARDDRLPQPLAPSGATALIEGNEHGPGSRVGPLVGGEVKGSAIALRRGTVVHRLLQVLPSWPKEQREAAARRYVERASSDLDGHARSKLIDDALRVLHNSALASLFEHGARTEVPIMGMLDVMGRPVPVSGVVDRMIVNDNEVLLIDYKTGRNPPDTEAAVPPVHVAQMALYRALLTPLFPNKPITCALVYTENVTRIDLGERRMNAMVTRILERGSLDAESGGLVQSEGNDSPDRYS